MKCKTKAIISYRTSSSGDEHSCVVAFFTSDEKLELFLEKLKIEYPDEHFEIEQDYVFVVDPVELSEIQ